MSEWWKMSVVVKSELITDSAHCPSASWELAEGSDVSNLLRCPISRQNFSVDCRQSTVCFFFSFFFFLQTKQETEEGWGTEVLYCRNGACGIVGIGSLNKRQQSMAAYYTNSRVVASSVTFLHNDSEPKPILYLHWSSEFSQCCYASAAVRNVNGLAAGATPRWQNRIEKNKKNIYIF